MKLTTACMIAAAALVAAPAIAAEPSAAEPAKTEKEVGHHNYKTVTGEELAKLIKDKKAIVVDSRSAEDYAKGHIDGAVNLPADKVDADTLKAVSADKKAALVFYCGNVKCPASAKSAEKAHGLGYTNVHKYPGGYEEWTEKKFM
ncbi:MAG: rhodanese-like domain-containing protein [Alphaproteobacteria bacterium]|nr:rhodanese-like domain-containing protein [Alphaproteobacteria bacterium]